MDSQLQKALAAIIEKTSSGISAGIDFLSGQLPDVIHQLLIWRAVYSAVQCFFAVIIGGVLAYFYYRVYRWWRDSEFEWIDHPEIMFFALTLFAWGIPAKMFSLDWLQIWIAPKIYLIEYAAKLAGK